MRRVSTTAPWPRPMEIPDEWMAACADRPPSTCPGRVPRAVELALVRGLIEERSQPGESVSRWTSAGSLAASLTIWGFAAYGLWSLLG